MSPEGKSARKKLICHAVSDEKQWRELKKRMRSSKCVTNHAIGLHLNQTLLAEMDVQESVRCSGTKDKRGSGCSNCRRTVYEKPLRPLRFPRLAISSGSISDNTSGTSACQSSSITGGSSIQNILTQANAVKYARRFLSMGTTMTADQTMDQTTSSGRNLVVRMNSVGGEVKPRKTSSHHEQHGGQFSSGGLQEMQEDDDASWDFDESDDELSFSSDCASSHVGTSKTSSNYATSSVNKILAEDGRADIILQEEDSGLLEDFSVSKSLTEDKSVDMILDFPLRRPFTGQSKRSSSSRSLQRSSLQQQMRTDSVVSSLSLGEFFHDRESDILRASVSSKNISPVPKSDVIGEDCVSQFERRRNSLYSLSYS
eukprot:CAMPEP_0194371988 /NCGR_PEP_ID=MMETSP0174-20130528/20299_1 /TAXON_ID=216777 /ORGANISM="Proboscia alata, Strain PI-D3" /LENGTH=369 /DNA_ID=CAMNT_0039150241 /DNA_START=206 /DNA_END=1311 /DNA_ORIENTATION=-